MAYNWRPTGTGVTTTTASSVVVPPRRAPTRSATPSEPPEGVRVATVVDEFIQAAEDGRARNRSGRSYRPSALRDVRGILRHHVAHELGHRQLRDVRREDVQALVDRLAEEGLSESRIRSVISAVRALYGYGIEHGYVEFSPANGLVVPREHEPAWRADDDVPAADDAGFDDAEPDWSWTDDVEDARRERSAGWSRPPRRPRDSSRSARQGRSRPERRADDFQPIVLLSERILSLVLRIVVVIFILFALATIAGST
jgi:hypothetical protein